MDFKMSKLSDTGVHGFRVCGEFRHVIYNLLLTSIYRHTHKAEPKYSVRCVQRYSLKDYPSDVRTRTTL
jgi:hypothetical protein